MIGRIKELLSSLTGSVNTNEIEYETHEDYFRVEKNLSGGRSLVNYVFIQQEDSTVITETHLYDKDGWGISGERRVYDYSDASKLSVIINTIPSGGSQFNPVTVATNDIVGYIPDELQEKVDDMDSRRWDVDEDKQRGMWFDEEGGQHIGARNE